MSAPVLYVALDIETCYLNPNKEVVLRQKLASTVEPDGRLKDPIKMKEDVERKIDAVIAKSSLNPNLGEISMIGLYFYDEELGEMTYMPLTRWGNYNFKDADGNTCIMPASEKTMLIAFRDFLQDQYDARRVVKLIGKGLLRFDLSFIRVRALYHGVDFQGLLPSVKKYTAIEEVIDFEETTHWPGSTHEHKPSLVAIAECLDIPCDYSSNGAELPDAYAMSNYDMIVQKNHEDVRLCYAIAQRCKYVPDWAIEPLQPNLPMRGVIKDDVQPF